LKRTEIIYLELSFIIAQIDKMFEHQHFNENQRINSSPTSTAFALLRIAIVEQWEK
jgi:hypothetical protein